MATSGKSASIRNRIRGYREVPASLIDGAPWNWRTHGDEQKAVVRASLEELGIIDALKVREMPGGRFQLFDGHLRSDLYVSISPDTIVPILVTDLDEAEAKKANAIFDPSGAMAEADAEKLKALLAEIETESAELESLFATMAQDNGLAEEVAPGAGGDEFDATPEMSGPTRAAVGDLWLIGGKHRLIVGDNTDAKNVERLMGGKTVGLCFTSPPYAQQRDYGEAAKEKVQDWYALMCGTFANLPMAHDGQVLVNLGLIHRDGEWVPYWDDWIEWMRSQGWRRFGWYVWDKGFSARDEGGRLSTSHEWIFHFNKKAVDPTKWIPCKTAGKTSEIPSRFSDEQGQYQAEGKTHTRASHRIASSIVEVNRGASRQTEHPAAFPVAVADYFIQSWPGDVYDPFLGSGTTLIAAHRLGRVCYGCEIEPRYGDVILKRAEAEGLTVEKIG